jgi:hypothetical protein
MRILRASAISERLGGIGIGRACLIATAVWVSLATAQATAPEASSVGFVDTLEINGGLSISVPVVAEAEQGGGGLDTVWHLGSITVRDNRQTANGSSAWLAQVTIERSDTAAACVAASSETLEYWSGPATATTGEGSTTPGQTDASKAEPGNRGKPIRAFSHVGGAGDSTSWRPSIRSRGPSLSSTLGCSQITVTHSVL